VNLRTLVELKLASGISDPHRGKDITDVEEMIRILHLPADLAVELNPYVREKYQELWQKLRVSTRPYVIRCRYTPKSGIPPSPDEISRQLEATVPHFRAMKSDGIELDTDVGVRDGSCYLYTYDRTIAEKYGMVHADELLDDFDEDSGDAAGGVSEISP
jgi:hypothetical protein